MDLAGVATDVAPDTGAAVSNACGAFLSPGGTLDATTAIAALATCPVWPSGKLFPEIGPFFYGPDPGPCAYKRVSLAADNNTFLTLAYRYSVEGQLTEYRNDWPIERYSLAWRDGRVSQITQTDDTFKTVTTAAYEWNDGMVIETMKTRVNRYALSPNGYPLSVVTTSRTDPSYCQIGIYDYNDCRLSAMRVLATESPSSTKGWTLAYAYDDQGHLISRTEDARSIADTYDYACWN
jgi:hypothetical protein